MQFQINYWTVSTVLVHEELEKHQRPKEELKKMWELKITVVLVVTGALG